MSIADSFRTFLGNIKIDNSETISLRYGEITAALNKKFRDTESKTANSLQVGSYGRSTAIKGVSDLDMLYIMPAGKWDDYKNGGQYRLLRACADAISDRYPSTIVKVDRLVVRVLYKYFHIEVQPVFEQDDGSFSYPDSYGDGSWKITKPRGEIEGRSSTNRRTTTCVAWPAWRGRGRTSTAWRWEDC
jgi:tRNA nucleotidyltransferase (CCA-adding enzyme)